MFIERPNPIVDFYSVENISNERETKSLAEAAKSVKEAKRFIIITYEEEKELNVDDIKIEVIPVWKWWLEVCFLQKNSK